MSAGRLEPATIRWGSGVVHFTMNRREFTDKGVILGVNPARAGGSKRAGAPGRWGGWEGPGDRVRVCLSWHDESAEPSRGESGLSGVCAGGGRGAFSRCSAVHRGVRRRCESVSATWARRCEEEWGGTGAGGLPGGGGEAEDGGGWAVVRGRDGAIAAGNAGSRDARIAGEIDGRSQAGCAGDVQALEGGGQLPAAHAAPVVAWQFGGQDLTLLALPDEVVSEDVRPIEDAVGPLRLWIAAYRDEVVGYIPSRRILAEGGYETRGLYIGRGWFTPEVEETLVRVVQTAATRAGRTPVRKMQRPGH